LWLLTSYDSTTSKLPSIFENFNHSKYHALTIVWDIVDAIVSEFLGISIGMLAIKIQKIIEFANKI
jgi:hypothetical protein